MCIYIYTRTYYMRKSHTYTYVLTVLHTSQLTQTLCPLPCFRTVRTVHFPGSRLCTSRITANDMPVPSPKRKSCSTLAGASAIAGRAGFVVCFAYKRHKHVHTDRSWHRCWVPALHIPHHKLRHVLCSAVPTLDCAPVLAGGRRAGKQLHFTNPGMAMCSLLSSGQVALVQDDMQQ